MTGTEENLAQETHADADAKQNDAAEPAAPSPEAAEDQAGGTGVPEPDPMDVLAIENAELRDRLLRALAETENLRKRAEREKAEATLYAATNFARDLLAVSDNMARALASMDEATREKADEATRNLLAGIELTQRELLNTFQKHGIVQVSPEGEKFDPNFHQAMFEVPTSEKPAGTVMQVVQTGYKIGERVLRPALVGVAKAES